MIPKIIHLCWFSGEQYPPLISRCIRSWHRKMPEYEIMLWNYDKAVSIDIPYIKEALEKKKWAFAADVVRLYALYNYGGVYLDSDVFLKKSIEPLLTNKFVSTIEYHKQIIDYSIVDGTGNRLVADVPIPGIGIQAAFIGAEPKNQFIEELLLYYKNKHFVLQDGNLDTSIIAPAHYAINAEKYGFKYIDKTQILGDITLHRSTLFAGVYREDNRHAVAIHCCNHSWADFTFKQKILFNISKVICQIKLCIYDLF